MRIGIREAASILGVSPFTVRDMVRRRQLPSYKIGARVLLDSRELEEYVRAHRIPAVREQRPDKTGTAVK